MARAMSLQALVISADSDCVSLMRRVFETVRIQSDSAGAERARELLAKRRFDAVVVDCDDLPNGAEALKNIRHTPSNKRSLIFAIVHGKTTVREAYDAGANFVLDKPLDFDAVVRSFRAAHGIMMRERRRYYRNPVGGAVQLMTSDGRPVLGKMLNLSEGGMSLEIPVRLERNAQVRVRFELPNGKSRIDAKAEVSWIGAANSLGVRFLHLDQAMQRDLEQWIAHNANTDAARPTSVFINATSRPPVAAGR